MRNFHMIKRNGNVWYLSFLLSFVPFVSTSTTSKTALNPSPSALILPHLPHYLPSSIPFLFCYEILQKSPWNISKTSQKSLVSLARATMYYLGILGIISTQKVWNSWELLFKMCCFLVVITPHWPLKQFCQRHDSHSWTMNFCWWKCMG